MLIKTTTTRIPYSVVMPKDVNGAYCACDICRAIGERGVFSPSETIIFDKILSFGCRAGQGVVIDIGANIGFFSLMAAKYGCRVHSFEPNLLPRSFLQASAIYNQLDDLVTIHPAAVGASKGAGRMQSNHAWGLQKVQIDSDATFVDDAEFQVLPLSSVVHEDALLIKVDTEGFEDSVFAGAWTYLDQKRVSNVLVEVKGFNTKSKRELLRNIATKAKLQRVYNYKEEYGGPASLLQLSQPRTMIDVTSIIINATQDTVPLEHEDFWLTNIELKL